MKKDKKNYKFLVIEDNPGDFVIVEDLLEEQILDPLIIHAVNYKQAADILLKDTGFHAILLDLTLPDKKGEQLITSILSITAGCCPVIVLTGYTDIEFSIKSISQGIMDYLLKDELTPTVLYKSIIYSIERRNNIAELKNSEKQYSDLFRLSPNPMCLYEAQTYNFTKVNKSTLDLFGYNEEEFLNMNLLQLVPPDEQEAAIKIITSEERMLNETYHAKTGALKKSGEIIELETSSTPILIDNTPLTLLTAIDVTEKNRFEHTIIKAIIKTQEDERYEIGSELHDNVCQILATSQLSLGMLKDSLSIENLQWFDKCREYILLAADEIRNLSHRLAPAFFDDSTLEEAFQILLDSFNIGESYKMILFVDESVKKTTLSLELQLNLYRILQEQLKNIFKYAKADLVEVEVIIYNGKLKMKILDNGVGFNPASIKKGIGLANMKRRTELFYGKFDLESTPGNGCSVLVDIPLTERCVQ